jgi:formate hydrogenlyase subunit 3/multisubunit Na+/H+ antiporter MnhD subunit
MWSDAEALWRTPAPYLVVLLAPLGLALLLLVPRRGRAVAEALAPWAALPALALGVLAPPDASARVPWWLLQGRFAVDDLGRIFLLFTALLWLLAGWYARGYLRGDPRRAGFLAFGLVTMTGNLGVVLSADLASFYACFALMTYAAYGLIVHERTSAARRAGRVYLVLALAGEAMILTAVLVIAAALEGGALADAPRAVAAADRPELLAALCFVGFGVKAALLPLHGWLPLAHPVAPTPASAVLSGAMIKAGLLGWLRLLPLGEAALPILGAVALAAGIGGAFYAALVGLTQRDAKTILAYSSVSQMGLMTVVVGAALAVPRVAPEAMIAVTYLALHHGLAKGSLFLAVGVAGARLTRRWRAAVALGIAIPGLALVGFPATSGAVGKAALKAAAVPGAGAAGEAVGVLLSLAAAATLLLLVRFAQEIRARAGEGAEPPPATMGAAWAISVLAVACAGWLVPSLLMPGLARGGLGAADLWSALWPVVIGAAIAGAAAIATRRRGLRLPALPAGDLVVLGERAAPRLAAIVVQLAAQARRLASRGAGATRQLGQAVATRLGPALGAERSLTTLTGGGALVLAVVLGGLLAMLVCSPGAASR